MAPGQDHTLHHTSWNQGWTGFHHQPLGHPATLVSIHWSPRVPSSTAPRSGSRDGGSCQHLTLRQKGRVRHSQLEGGSQPSAHQGEGLSLIPQMRKLRPSHRESAQGHPTGRHRTRACLPQGVGLGLGLQLTPSQGEEQAGGGMGIFLFCPSLAIYS